LDFWAIFGRFIEDALAMVEVAFAEPGKSSITGFLSDVHLCRFACSSNSNPEIFLHGLSRIFIQDFFVPLIKPAGLND